MSNIIPLAEVVVVDSFKHPGLPDWQAFNTACYNNKSKFKYDIEYDTQSQLVHIRCGGKTVSVHASRTKTMVLLEDAGAIAAPVTNVPPQQKVLSGAALRAQQAKKDAQSGFDPAKQPV